MGADERRRRVPVTRDEAVAIVRLLLDALEAQSGARYAVIDGGPDGVGVQDHGDAWIVPWNAAEFVATGDPRRLLIGSGPYVVAKDDGAVAMLPATMPVDESLARWRAQRAATAG